MFAQRFSDDGATALAQVTFCVIDLETTGGAPGVDAITEIGALKSRCGEVTGTLQTFVDPERAVPTFVRLLTGISDGMLAGAPPIRAVLPALIEFIGGSVIVAHNARFDVGFLNAALSEHGYPPLANHVVDTARLARRILSGEVRDHRLATLSAHLRCAHRPCHRAFADVLATTDVLHCLLERVGNCGVTTLDDLESMTATRLDGTFAKISMADGIPHEPGVYRFLDTGGRTLYVGKASDLRARVRSYFYGDPRGRMRDLLREASDVTVAVYSNSLEAAVAEARAIAREVPPYNRSGKRRAAHYVRLPLGPKPRLACTRVPKEDGALYLGPLMSSRRARRLLEAIVDAAGLYPCRDPDGRRGCPFCEMGRCVDPNAFRERLRAAAVAMVTGPDLLLQRLDEKMRRRARQGRYEEAAETRNRRDELERAIRLDASLRALTDAGEVVLALNGRALLIADGQLAAAIDLRDDDYAGGVVDRLRRGASWTPVGRFWPPDVHAEARAIASWLRANHGCVRLLHVTGAWVEPVAWTALAEGGFDQSVERLRGRARVD